jgi:hypothetical protein
VLFRERSGVMCGKSIVLLCREPNENPADKPSGVLCEEPSVVSGGEPSTCCAV